MSIANLNQNGQGFKGPQSYRGGTNYFVFTSAMGTTPQAIKLNSAGRICQITNTIMTAQVVALSIYDSNTTVNPGTNGNLLYTIIPGASSAQSNPTIIDIPFNNGLVVVASGAIAGTVLIQYI